MAEDKSNEIIPIGIVLTNGSHSFILAIDDASPESVIWEPTIDVPELPNITKESEVYNDMNGMTNTEKILSYAKSTSESFPAADLASKYKPFLKDRTHWYLPSSGELLLVDQYKKHINDALEDLGKPKLSDWYWPSSEENERISWLIPADYCHLDNQPKNQTKAKVIATASLPFLK